jgi:hypothetical protein
MYTCALPFLSDLSHQPASLRHEGHEDIDIPIQVQDR